MVKMGVEEDKESKKNVIFPTKLSFEETYPEDSGYKTPDSIKFLRKFDFSKEK